MMETMGDLLSRAQELIFHGFSAESAKKIFSWEVEDVAAGTAEADESAVFIHFKGGLVLFARYFLNLDPTETEDTCEIMLALKTDMRSRIRYKVFYSGYIHGQGYIRIQISETENAMVKRILDDFYMPALKMIYKPIITQFKGFLSKDYFGIQANNKHGEIYYSSVRSRSESIDLEVSKVIGRLHELDCLLREPAIRHSLAELDLQLSLLPSVVWSSL